MNKGAIAILISAIMMGSLAVFVRNVHMHPTQVAFFRLFTGLLYLSLLVILTKEEIRIKNPKLVLLLAITNVFTITFYISSIQLVEAATAALLLYMAPLYVIPIAYLMGEKIDKMGWFAIPIGILGLYLMLSPYGNLNIGILFGFLSGICYSLVFILTKKVREFMSSIQIVFINLLVASIILSPTLFLFPIKIDLNTVYWILALGLIPTALAFILFNYGIKYCKIEQGPILALIEPVSAGFFGYAVFSEIFEFKQLIGAGLILFSVFIALKES
ncbi:MAG: EamA family transporter [Archaeoglobaceae archaeon]|nr:EamA family transporter [Archaeoglobaceae archaeon]